MWKVVSAASVSVLLILTLAHGDIERSGYYLIDEFSTECEVQQRAGKENMAAEEVTTDNRWN
jgi:hypothetical protein